MLALFLFNVNLSTIFIVIFYNNTIFNLNSIEVFDIFALTCNHNPHEILFCHLTLTSPFSFWF
ncbi:hypothetical protein H1P_660006 [Hyella patelloides LEGE 07179]|uniref:Uncharacterized protein n=1 Tax=Hyella patelloides LEGE 07179 TaxID=945734 RepID=A0A563W2L4_9CYAN|nr:hypothetical protein H1P_660006 [Hyella patelloides LEGE 07179]